MQTILKNIKKSYILSMNNLTILKIVQKFKKGGLQEEKVPQEGKNVRTEDNTSKTVGTVKKGE